MHHNHVKKIKCYIDTNIQTGDKLEENSLCEVPTKHLAVLPCSLDLYWWHEKTFFQKIFVFS